MVTILTLDDTGKVLFAYKVPSFTNFDGELKRIQEELRKTGRMLSLFYDIDTEETTLASAVRDIREVFDIPADVPETVWLVQVKAAANREELRLLVDVRIKSQFIKDGVLTFVATANPLTLELRDYVLVSCRQESKKYGVSYDDIAKMTQ